MSSETERFTTPFTDGKKGTEDVIDDTKTSNNETDALNDTEVTKEQPGITENPDVVIINGIAYTKQVEKHRLPAMVRVPDNLKARIDVIAAYERRKVTSVVEIALDEFLKTPICEPRPFLPFSGKECTFRLSFYTDRAVSDAIDARAKVECRAAQDLIRRAILNYVEVSPYDPVQIQKGVGGIDVSGNLPDEDSEVEE